MSSSNFTVTEHTSPCSFIRQYPHGVKHEDAILQLAVKEYRPVNPPSSSHEAVTIILAHGNGFPKEMYEPFITDLLHASNPPLAIHSIWTADQANQSASHALNAAALGDDPNWLDHSLDLLLLLNTFRTRLKPPLIGIGHSMGATQLTYLATMHPRLLHSLVLIDPVMVSGHPPGPHAALFSSLRREKWDSREKAEAQISRSPFYAAMDGRVLKRFLAYGLRDVEDGGVVLATPRAQEAWSFARSNLRAVSAETETERLLNPELVPGSEPARLVSARGDLVVVCEALPHLRPRALFVYGEKSNINPPPVRKFHASLAGSGRGGSGGIKEGGVEQQVLEECGHLCVFEKPAAVAESVAGWVGKEVERWKREKKFWDEVDTKKSKNGRTELSDEWMKMVKMDTKTERPQAGGKTKL